MLDDEKIKESPEDEENPNAEGEEGEEGSEEELEGNSSGKKKLIIIIAIVILLLGGGGAGLFLSGALSGGGEEKVEEEKLLPQIIYYDLEEFLVNLNNPGKQVSFLKMTVTLELASIASKSMVEMKLPRIRDNFQIYLRELRNSDLQGSAGMHRLKEELLLRINKVVAPEKVTDILFKEVIVQ